MLKGRNNKLGFDLMQKEFMLSRLKLLLDRDMYLPLTSKSHLGPWQKSCYCKVDIQAVDLIKNHIHGLNSNHFQIVHNLHIHNMKRSCCLPYTTFQSMSFSQIEQILGKQRHTKEINGPSSSSVVTWVIRARFLTSPQASPSGVSHGQSIPHCYTN